MLWVGLAMVVGLAAIAGAWLTLEGGEEPVVHHPTAIYTRPVPAAQPAPDATADPTPPRPATPRAAGHVPVVRNQAPIARPHAAASTSPARSIPSVTSTSSPPRPERSAHVDAARQHVEHHFRYAYFGSRSVLIESLQIEPRGASEVPGWSQVRTEGRVGIAYFDTRLRKLERITKQSSVVTEDRDGYIRPIDLQLRDGFTFER